jgi:DNA polymerase-1
MQLRLFQESHEVDWAALNRCLQASIISIDVETDTRWAGRGPKLDYGLSYHAAVTIIALAWLENGKIETTAIAAPFTPDSLDFLKKLFQGTALFVAHNAVFDMRQLGKLSGGIIPARIWDTMAMARLLHPRLDTSYNLISVASMLTIPVPERQASMKQQRSKLHLIPLEQSVEYAQDDVRLTLEIYQKQARMEADASLIDWEIRAMQEYCRMTVRGIRLNSPFLETRLESLRKERDKLAFRLAEDGLYTPSSPKARAKYLYETKALPLPKWNPKSWHFTRAGRRRLNKNPEAKVELSDLSTSSYIIESYLEEGSPLYSLLKDLVAYLEVDWLISNMQSLADHAALDGRLHSLVTIATESGRRASSYPHMQNWKMPAMAGLAIGDEGFTLVEIDYSNAENVMAAFISSDDKLAAACVADDFHSTMALEYFGKTWEEADKDERKELRTMSKKISYGTLYGMGAERLGESIGVSTEEARRMIRAKDVSFAKLTKLRRAAQQEVEKSHQLRLWTGRPVSVPTAFVAWNYLCQGGVSELLKRAIVLISEAYRNKTMRSRVALDMHDALILEVAHEEWDEALEMASEIMENVIPLEQRERTTPSIHWRAKPNLKENRQKWGAEQWHPES